MKKISIVTCACLMWGAPVGADVIVDWNVHTAQAIATAGGARPGHRVTRLRHGAPGDARRHPGVPEAIRTLLWRDRERLGFAHRGRRHRCA